MSSFASFVWLVAIVPLSACATQVVKGHKTTSHKTTVTHITFKENLFLNNAFVKKGTFDKYYCDVKEFAKKVLTRPYGPMNIMTDKFERKNYVLQSKHLYVFAFLADNEQGLDEYYEVCDPHHKDVNSHKTTKISFLPLGTEKTLVVVNYYRDTNLFTQVISDVKLQSKDLTDPKFKKTDDDLTVEVRVTTNAKLDTFTNFNSVISITHSKESWHSANVGTPVIRVDGFELPAKVTLDTKKMLSDLGDVAMENFGPFLDFSACAVTFDTGSPDLNGIPKPLQSLTDEYQKKFIVKQAQEMMVVLARELRKEVLETDFMKSGFH